MRIAFRVDASKDIGIGHLMRCLALSEEFTKRGDTCYFLSKIDDVLEREIRHYNVNFKRIGKGINHRDDLELLIKFSKQNNIDWVITDHYGINSNYIKNVKQNGFKVLSIDDCAQMYYISDVVVNQNIGAERLKIQADENTKLLLGPKYVMIRDEILIRDKKTKKKVDKILITLGGSDRENFTLRILKLLESFSEIAEFLVVLGQLNPFFKKINDYAKNSNNRILVVKSPKNMATIYQESDIAISAGGSSCYELAYFGIPNIIIVTADNQLNVANELYKSGISLYLGTKEDLDSEKLKNNLLKFIKEDRLREKMSRNGMQLVDGAGKQRIVEFMGRYH